VGGYWFSDDYDEAPEVQAARFVAHLPKRDYRHHLAPVLDIEIGEPDVELGQWAVAFLATVKKLYKAQPLIYSYASFLQLCRFSKAPAPLWVAAFDRNDGREHPFFVPRPWKYAAAHQYSSRAHVFG